MASSSALGTKVSSSSCGTSIIGGVEGSNLGKAFELALVFGAAFGLSAISSAGLLILLRWRGSLSSSFSGKGLTSSTGFVPPLANCCWSKIWVIKIAFVAVLISLIPNSMAIFLKSAGIFNSNSSIEYIK